MRLVVVMMVLWLAGCAVVKDKDEAALRFRVGTTGLLGAAAGIEVDLYLGVRDRPAGGDDDREDGGGDLDDLLGGL